MLACCIHSFNECFLSPYRPCCRHQDTEVNKRDGGPPLGRWHVNEKQAQALSGLAGKSFPNLPRRLRKTRIPSAHQSGLGSNLSFLLSCKTSRKPWYLPELFTSHFCSQKWCLQHHPTMLLWDENGSIWISAQHSVWAEE